MDTNPQTMSSSTPAIKNYGSPLAQAILLIIVLVLFSWFILKPKMTQLAQQRSELKAAQTQLAGIRSDQESLNQLVQDLHDSSDQVAKVDEALPLNGRVSKVYVLLDSLVRSSGMNLTLISADDTSKSVSAGDKPLLENPYQPGRTLHTIILTTSVTGTMEQFKNLLQLVETSGRVLDIDSVEVLGGEGVTKFRVSVKAYAYEQLDGKTTSNAK
ncbi:MAG TPA: hypothetical protein VHQ41_00140 [Patescibacteria group bacterium]|jgi:Tfp pilus assembly protein PilO|nr:hypothetical protein [Patescibacteria group bacterium]